MPIQFHDKAVIDDLFFTCIALHNIIARWDGKDQWAERGVSWEKADGHFEDDDADQQNWARPSILRDGKWVKVSPSDDYSNIGRVALAENQRVLWAEPGSPMPMGEVDLKRLVDLHTESDANFRSLQSKLVKNFSVRDALGKIYWLR